MLDSFLLIDSLNLSLLCSVFSQSLLLFLLFFQVGSLIPRSANIDFFLDKKVMKILKPLKWNIYIIHSCHKFITVFENCFTEFHCSHFCGTRQWKKYSLTIQFFIIQRCIRIFCGFSSLWQREKLIWGICENLHPTFLEWLFFRILWNTSQQWVYELWTKRFVWAH